MATKASTDVDTNNIQRVYLFTGEIDSRRTKAVDRIIAKVIEPGFETFDVERFDGESSSIDSILSAASVIPFASKMKVAVVDRIDKMNADGQSRVASIIPKLGERSCLILLASEDSGSKRKSSAQSQDKTDEDDGKQKKGLRSEITAAVKKRGSVVNFDRLKAQDLSTLAMGMVKSSGRRIDPPALQALVRAAESNPASLEREIEKLVTYTDGRDSITLADVDNLVPRPPEDRVFPLIDAVAAGRAELAVQMLGETFAASSKPDNEVLKVVSLLARHFRILYQAKWLTTEGGFRGLASVPDETRAMLMHEQNPLSMGDWQRNKLMDQIHHFSLSELKHCLGLILECEMSCKGAGKHTTSPRASLDMLVLRLSQRKSIPLTWS